MAAGSQPTPNHFMPCARIAGLVVTTASTPWAGAGYLEPIANHSSKSMLPIPLILSLLKTSGAGFKKALIGIFLMTATTAWLIHVPWPPGKYGSAAGYLQFFS